MSSLFASGPVLLDSADKMFAVLKELSAPDGLTWRGHIDVWGEEGAGPAQWRLFLNDNKGGKVRSLVDLQDGVLVGEYLFLTYGRLLVLDPDEV